MDTNGPAAEFDAVEHDVVGLGTYFSGSGIQQAEVFVQRGGEGVMLGDVAVLRGIVIEAGENGRPREIYGRLRGSV